MYLLGEVARADEVEDVIAEIYAWVGDNDAAFEWLDKVYELYESAPVNFVMGLMFRNLHDDRRLKEFLEKLGKSPEQFAAIEFDPVIPK